MKHFVITVGCEFGSGGPEIGKMLAKSLGIEYYDRDLVDKVVEKIGVEKHLVEEADNKNFVPYGIETSLGTRYANLSNKVIYTQFDVIRKMDEVYSQLIEDEIELERKNVQLEQTQQFVYSVLTAMTDVLIVCGADGQIEETNAALCELVGRSDADLRGVPVFQLFADERSIAGAARASAPE